MTQRQLDVLNSEEFADIVFLKSEVICALNKQFSLIVKQHNSSIYVLLRSGRKCLKLPLDIFNLVCDSQLSVSFIRNWLESHHDR